MIRTAISPLFAIRTRGFRTRGASLAGQRVDELLAARRAEPGDVVVARAGVERSRLIQRPELVVASGARVDRVHVDRANERDRARWIDDVAERAASGVTVQRWVQQAEAVVALLHRERRHAGHQRAGEARASEPRLRVLHLAVRE